MPTVSFPIPPELRNTALGRANFAHKWRNTVFFMVGGFRVMPSLTLCGRTYGQLQQAETELTEAVATGPADVTLLAERSTEHQAVIRAFGQDAHTEEEWDALYARLGQEWVAARQAARLMLFGATV